MMKQKMKSLLFSMNPYVRVLLIPIPATLICCIGICINFVGIFAIIQQLVSNFLGVRASLFEIVFLLTAGLTTVMAVVGMLKKHSLLLIPFFVIYVFFFAVCLISLFKHMFIYPKEISYNPSDYRRRFYACESRYDTFITGVGVTYITKILVEASFRKIGNFMKNENEYEMMLIQKV